jgi:hypothetical protein
MRRYVPRVFLLLALAYGSSADSKPKQLPTPRPTAPRTVAPDPEPDLVAYYPFAGNARDAGPAKLHGVVKGAKPVPDRHGCAASAYGFDGEGTVELPVGPVFPSGPFTLAFDMRFDQFPHVTRVCLELPCPITSRAILDKGVLAITMGKWGGESYVYPTVRWRTGGTRWGSVQRAVKLNRRRFYHLTITFDGSTLRTYVDGVEKYAGDAQDPPPREGAPLRLGATSGIDQGFVGVLDEVRIFRRALDAAEVAALYAESTRPSKCPMRSVGGVMHAADSGAGTHGP